MQTRDGVPFHMFKKILISTICLLTLTVSAVDVKLTWDSITPYSKYTIFLNNSTINNEFVPVIMINNSKYGTINLTNDGTYKIYVTSNNIIQSEPSNIISVKVENGKIKK